ncbi:cytochrome c oxidase assembly protein [Pseudonocardia sp. GCM10023141]|uniref:cytochrome c oxidase assembly protein n=1 Tax=Pseudonocardia sp. GCM10023141 TaxID=3252653 RepID=UPI003611D7B8
MTVLFRVLVALAGAALAALLAPLDSSLYARLGLPLPGAGTAVLVPLLRTVAELGAGATVGSLLFAAFVVAPQRSGVLDVDGYLAVRRAAWAAVPAGLAALALVPLLAADLTGSTPGGVVAAGSWDVLAALGEPVAWLVAAVGLLVVGAAAFATLRWWVAPLLLVVALVAVAAPGVAGQFASGAGHDWATDASVLQNAAAACAVGLLVSVRAQLRRGVRDATAIRRTAGLVTGCLVVLGATAVLFLALWRGSVPGAAPWEVVADTRLVLLCLAGAGAATLWRRRTGAAAGVLVAGLLAAGVLGVVLTRWAPPRFLERADSTGESLLGYDLPEPVSAARLLLDWRFNIAFGLAAVAAGLLYAAGVRRLHRRGDAWARGRTTAWLLGCAVVLIATSSGVGRYAGGVFSIHMVDHMALNMLAPVLLAMGGPLTLALRALPAAGRGDPPGPREWIAAATASRPARLLTHPLLVLPIFVGSFYALYFTGLFELMLREHWAHQLMNLHFVAVGYLFFWPLCGVDPAPSRLPHIGRLAVLLAAMPFHAFFGITVMSTGTVLGGDFYRELGLPWLPALLGDQHLGGGIAWGSGELPMLLVVLVLLTRWSRDDAREAARHDRRADSDGESDLQAYNAMLARLAGSESTGVSRR